jgi:hypothetical protein
VAPPQMRKKTQNGVAMSNTAFLHDMLEFYASFCTLNSEQTKVPGTLRIINGGRVVKLFPLRGDGGVDR